ncbi:hypothetical protein ACLVWU_13790 [Bdellovibrio sp. HCB290]|uniref:hypothetical protein n=1 Tax=Bdellovibrio sp. HCB290 TaxID=3394356 RepID=UPI0039B40CF1
MIKRLRILLITTSLMFLGAFAFAQASENIRELVFNGRVNARSSPEFTKNSRNILSTVPPGSKAEVVTTKRMNSSGSYAVQVRLTSVGTGKTKAKVGDLVWVFYNKKNPWLKFRDGDDVEMQNPESALAKQSREAGASQPAPSSNDDKSIDPNEAMPDQSRTEAGMGGNCKLTNSCGGTEANRNDLKDVATKALDDAASKSKKPKDLKKDSPEVAASDSAKAKDDALYARYKKRRYTMSEHDWKNFPKIAKYSNDPKTQKMIRSAMANKEPYSTSMCYQYVKRAGMAGGWLKKYPPGGEAKDAVRDLKAQGFTNLMESPYKGIIKTPDDAPKGAILVYATSDKNEAGDIQIKTDWESDGGYVSDFVRPRDMSQGKDGSFMTFDKAKRFARKGKPYKIIGVMVKI